MEIADSQNHAIHLTLKELIAKKSKRDQKNFTLYQLAKALDMPHSMLLRLMHPNPNKRVNNPRVDTLTRIVEFFRSDGFNISVDEILEGLKSKTTKSTIDVTIQNYERPTLKKSVPVYSFNASKLKKLFIADINLPSHIQAKNIIALLSDDPIEPIFKKGSVFVINADELEPKEDALVAIKLSGHKKILIRKFCTENHKKVFKSFDVDDKPILITSKLDYLILGVVIQVNAQT